MPERVCKSKFSSSKLVFDESSKLQVESSLSGYRSQQSVHYLWVKLTDRTYITEVTEKAPKLKRD